jgi:hypothetical protein
VPVEPIEVPGIGAAGSVAVVAVYIAAYGAVYDLGMEVKQKCAGVARGGWVIVAGFMAGRNGTHADN